jgi:hypothetical protein
VNFPKQNASSHLCRRPKLPPGWTWRNFQGKVWHAKQLFEHLGGRRNPIMIVMIVVTTVIIAIITIIIVKMIVIIIMFEDVEKRGLGS